MLRYGWPIGWRRSQTALRARRRTSASPSTSRFRVTTSRRWKRSTARAPRRRTTDGSSRRARPRRDLAQARRERRLARHAGRAFVAAIPCRRLRARGRARFAATLPTPSSPLPCPTARHAVRRPKDAPVAHGSWSSRSRCSPASRSPTRRLYLARARSLLRAPEHTAGLALSDMLLFRVVEGAPESLDAALAAAVPGDTLSRARPSGSTGRRTASPNRARASTSALPSSASIGAGSAGQSSYCDWRSRTTLSASAGTTHRPAAPGQVISRAISLDLANQSPGKYRITVGLIRADGSIVASTRVIELRD